MAPALSMTSLPFLYRAFFLWIEPIATAVGAYYAWFRQDEYMDLTYPTALVSVRSENTRLSRTIVLWVPHIRDRDFAIASGDLVARRSMK